MTSDIARVLKQLCSGQGHVKQPTEGEILVLDRLRPVYGFIDLQNIVTRTVGEDRLKLRFAPKRLDTLCLVTFSLPGGAPPLSFDFEFEVFSSRFVFAHGPSGDLIFDLRASGNYPVLFTGTVSGTGQWGSTDATEFELIHKPEPKPYPPRPGRTPQ